MTGRQKKFTSSVKYPDKFYHPRSGELVSKEKVEADVQWTGNKVREELIEKFAKDPKALEAEIDRQNRQAQRSLGRGIGR